MISLISFCVFVLPEDAPCGPIAFWAFRDHVCNENALVVAQHADIGLRDELGATMLHKVVQKHRPAGKVEIVNVLLDRGVDLAARDFEGSTGKCTEVLILSCGVYSDFIEYF